MVYRKNPAYLLVTLFGLLVLVLCSGCTSSPNISGTWRDSQNADTFYFLQSGDSVKGTVTELLGSVDFTGKMNGNTLDFSAEFWGQPVSGHIVFANDGKTAQVTFSSPGSSSGTYMTIIKDENS